jgi:hypothetical protein
MCVLLCWFFSLVTRLLTFDGLICQFPSVSPPPPSANRGLFTSKAGTSYAPVVLASGAMGVMGCYESSPKIKRDTWHRYAARV